jgi:hypothetical protein
VHLAAADSFLHHMNMARVALVAGSCYYYYSSARHRAVEGGKAIVQVVRMVYPELEKDSEVSEVSSC